MLTTIAHQLHGLQASTELRVSLERRKCLETLLSWRDEVDERQQYRLALGHFVQYKEERALHMWRGRIRHLLVRRMLAISKLHWVVNASWTAFTHLRVYTMESTAVGSAFKALAVGILICV